MHHIDIVIPTRHRWDKLQRTLATIPQNSMKIRTIVVCDGDPVIHKKLYKSRAMLLSVLEREHLGAVGCRNKTIKKRTAVNGILYATDDIEFAPGTFDGLLEEFNAHFPDDDGVMGLRQQDPNHHPSGVALMGRKFYERYPLGFIFYPEYWHFAAQEVGDLAVKLGKFYHTVEPYVKHYHPGKHKDLVDQTHKDARQHILADQTLRRARVAKGLLWGDAETEEQQLAMLEAVLPGITKGVMA